MTNENSSSSDQPKDRGTGRGGKNSDDNKPGDETPNHQNPADKHAGDNDDRDRDQPGGDASRAEPDARNAADQPSDDLDDAAKETGASRAPATIELAKSEFSSDTAAGPQPADARERPARRVLYPLLAGLIGGLCGGAAVLVWNGSQPSETGQLRTQLSEMQQRVTELSQQASRAEAAAKSGASANAAPVAAATSRIDALEKAVAAMRGDISKSLAESSQRTDALEARIKEIGEAQTRPSSDPQLAERLAKLEAATVTNARSASEAAAQPELQQLTLATALAGAVQRHEAFAALLAATKRAAGERAATLAPLDAFADTGVPSDAKALQDLRGVLSAIKAAAAPAPAKTDAPAPTAANEGLLGRLQTSLSQAIRIERDTPQAERADVSALDKALDRNDLEAARRELAATPTAAQPQAQAWLQAMQRRAAALDALAKFQADALAAVTAGER